MLTQYPIICNMPVEKDHGEIRPIKPLTRAKQVALFFSAGLSLVLGTCDTPTENRVTIAIIDSGKNPNLIGGTPEPTLLPNIQAPTFSDKLRCGVRKAVNFVRVSPVQQLSMAACLGLEVFFAEKVFQGYHYPTISFEVFTLASLATAGFNEALAYDKYLEYKKVRGELERRGWDERIINPKSHSWCQRNAARAAAIDTGYKDEVDSYYAREGHKWYLFFT